MATIYQFPQKNISPSGSIESGYHTFFTTGKSGQLINALSQHSGTRRTIPSEPGSINFHIISPQLQQEIRIIIGVLIAQYGATDGGQIVPRPDKTDESQLTFEVARDMRRLESGESLVRSAQFTNLQPDAKRRTIAVGIVNRAGSRHDFLRNHGAFDLPELV